MHACMYVNVCTYALCLHPADTLSYPLHPSDVSLRRQRILCKFHRPKLWPATRADTERVTRAAPAAELAQIPSPALWPATRAIAERVSVPPPPVQEGHNKWLCVRPGPVCRAAPGSEEAPTNVLEDFPHKVGRQSGMLSPGDATDKAAQLIRLRRRPDAGP